MDFIQTKHTGGLIFLNDSMGISQNHSKQLKCATWEPGFLQQYHNYVIHFTVNNLNGHMIFLDIVLLIWIQILILSNDWYIFFHEKWLLDQVIILHTPWKLSAKLLNDHNFRIKMRAKIIFITFE